DLGSIYAAAANAAPGADPEITSAIAQASAGPGDAAQGALAAHAYTTYAQTATNLANQPLNIQQQQFGNATAGEQDRLQAAGYKPSGGHHGGGFPGFVGDIAPDVPNAVPNPVGRDVIHPAGQVIGDVANALGSPLRQVDRVARTAMYVVNQANQAEGV